MECAGGAGSKKGVEDKDMKDKEGYADQQRAISSLEENKSDKCANGTCDLPQRVALD